MNCLPASKITKKGLADSYPSDVAAKVRSKMFVTSPLFSITLNTAAVEWHQLGWVRQTMPELQDATQLFIWA